MPVFDDPTTNKSIVDLYEKFKDQKFVTYIAKRFILPKPLDVIALELGYEVGIFHRLFVEFPDLELKFKNAVEAEASNEIDLLVKQGSTQALRRLVEIIDPLTPALDNKDLITACRAILSVSKPTGKAPENSDLDNLMKDLITGGNGE